MDFHALDDFTRQYIFMALSTSTDESGEPLSTTYIYADIAPDTFAQTVVDCRKFQEANAELLAGLDASKAGHDFWLTRNGHGAGFWDGDYSEEAGLALTKASNEFGEFNLYIRDDDLIHGYQG